MQEMIVETKFTGRTGTITRNIRADLGIMSHDFYVGNEVHECTLPKTWSSNPKEIKRLRRFQSKNVAIRLYGPDNQPIYTIPANAVKWNQ